MLPQARRRTVHGPADPFVPKPPPSQGPTAPVDRRYRAFSLVMPIMLITDFS